MWGPPGAGPDGRLDPDCGCYRLLSSEPPPVGATARRFEEPRDLRRRGAVPRDEPLRAGLPVERSPRGRPEPGRLPFERGPPPERGRSPRGVGGALGRHAVTSASVRAGDVTARARAVVAATLAGTRPGGRGGAGAPATRSCLGVREREVDVGEADVGTGVESLHDALQRGRGRGVEVGAEPQVPDEFIGVAEFVVGDEGDDDALGAGASGAAGAVEVGLVVDRWVEVEHAGNAVDVDAARGDIGGDERLDIAIGEGLERAVALVLRARAVDGGDGGAGAFELLRNAVRATTGCGRRRWWGRRPGSGPR